MGWEDAGARVKRRGSAVEGWLHRIVLQHTSVSTFSVGGGTSGAGIDRSQRLPFFFFPLWLLLAFGRERQIGASRLERVSLLTAGRHFLRPSLCRRRAGALGLGGDTTPTFEVRAPGQSRRGGMHDGRQPDCERGAFGPSPSGCGSRWSAGGASSLGSLDGVAEGCSMMVTGCRFPGGVARER